MKTNKKIDRTVSTTAMIDNRLIGTWKSDARTTLKEMRKRADMTDNQLRNFRSIFGRLEIKYTRKKYFIRYDDYCSSGAYIVLGKDSDSVVTVSFDELFNEDRLEHIHFEGARYWIALGTYREWFKRIA